MKNIFIIICSLFFSLAHSQTVYEFYVELDNYENAPLFERVGEFLIYDDKDEEEGAFFSNYDILEFYQAFSSSRRERTLNIFLVKTLNAGLMNDMTATFPLQYLSAEDITGRTFELLSSYTNDYDIGNPAANYDLNVNYNHLEYINTPKAWDYTYGNSDVLIGISDTNIDTSDVDFKFKTTLATGYIGAPYTMTPGLYQWHGTASAGFAAAQGDNSHGSVGVCSDCNILASFYTYNNLLNLAYEGADIINMSWAYYYYTPITCEQWIFDEIHDLGIVLVAGAGNLNPYPDTYYAFPASYNHVISVTSVNHKNDFGDHVIIDPTYGPMSHFVKDMIHHAVATNYLSYEAYSPYQTEHTNNDRVDLCAPGIDVFQYPWFVLGHTDSSSNPLYYGWGTSTSSPLVAGTAGLMLSINKCLAPDEVEDVLMLSAKNIESLAGNEPFIGRTGAGKLETGDAVEFTYEMKSTTGNALIENHDFYRFAFDLHHINNKLTISKQIFRDACIADFTAKNEIEILPGSDFNPNTDGLVDLKVDEKVDADCSNLSRMANKPSKAKKQKKSSTVSNSVIYPNPNDGAFTIRLDKNRKNVTVQIYDIYGKVVYNDMMSTISHDVRIANIASGLYVIKLSSDNYSETIKFIKK